jgi:chloramphenicol O-acetyltransferase type A
MRTIDMQTWSRRNHFKFYTTFEHPHFSMCANVDTTTFHPFVKRNGYSFTVSMVYVISLASNAIPEFRHRIRGDQVVEHEVVHPGFTVLSDDDLFKFCDLEHVENYSKFSTDAKRKIAEAKAQSDLEVIPGKDDVLFMSSIPWVSFTSFTHPMPVHTSDSIPRYAWGKSFQEGSAMKMPLGVQGHHAVMDGIHMGRFYEKVQEYLYHPEVVLGEA